jgi:lysyl-tRNA synthetase class 2
MNFRNLDDVKKDFPREQNEQMQVKREKLEKMLANKLSPFALAKKPDTYSNAFLKAYQEQTKKELEDSAQKHRMAGRIIAKRDFGKAAFVQVQDEEGRFQAYLSKNELGESFQDYKDYSDVGDIVFIEGTPMKTKTGEVTLKATVFHFLTKSLRPLPEKYHGMTDVELRYRQRYLDLIMSEKSRETFQKRNKMIQVIREFFMEKGFMEVETPMMHSLVGGAAAKPFVTHHNTLDMDLFLRIAPELFLKRLVVGGFSKVFEINRNFRNEGISIQHNPEFTMLEFYMAYANYEDLMDLTEELIKKVCTELNGKEVIQYQGQELDFSKAFERITVREALKKYAGLSPDLIEDKDELSEWLKSKKVCPEELYGKNFALGHAQMLAFEEEVESQLIQPTFVTEFPVEVSPLSRRNEKDPRFVDRFELFVYGREIANAFNELNDPDDQYSRFCEQALSKAEGNAEACDVDMDYIRALEYGLPPTAGEGIGIDRLAMLMTDSASIRDVILFPQLRSDQQHL